MVGGSVAAGAVLGLRGIYARRVESEVETTRVPRSWWVAGLMFACVCVASGFLLGERLLLIASMAGFLLASFPLIARLDAVKADGPLLSVRRGVRWTGPVDLRNLVALDYVPMAPRRPAVWLLIQWDTGPQLRLPTKLGMEADLRRALADHDDLRVVQVAAGQPFSQIPGLAELLRHYASSSNVLVGERARAALERYLA